MDNNKLKVKLFLDALRGAFGGNIPAAVLAKLFPYSENHIARIGARFAAAVIRLFGVKAFNFQIGTLYHIEVVRGGEVIYTDDFHNIVVNVGLDDILDKYFKGSAYTAAWYVGLTDGTPTTAAGDTMASHAGWVEVTAYSESVRQTLTLGSVSSQSVDNSASPASFSINANGTTIGGAFIADGNTKGGTADLLYGVAAFSAGDVTLNSGDTLNVTATLTAAAA